MSVGALGAAVSTTKDKLLLAALVLLIPSVAVAVIEWMPSDKASGVKLKTPLLSSVAWPSSVPPEEIATTELASAVIVNVGVLSLVNNVVVETLGIAGATVSTSIVKMLLAGLVLFAPSVAVAVIE